MRTLKFIVDGQIILRDPYCSFNHLVPGTEGYIKAEFTFTKEWDKCAKVAQFKSEMGTEFPPQILEDGYSCIIPAEALAKKKFRVVVLGKGNEYILTTNDVTVHQNGGNK